MSSHHVLVLGGSGKIARLLTPLLLQRSWTVTSLIRSADQGRDLQKLGASQPGKLNVLVRSLEDVKSVDQARSILDEVKPDHVVWSAGAGGKGGPERTFAVDRDAATHFIRASVKTPTITKFLLVSYIGSRLTKPAWWDGSAWAEAVEVNEKILPAYYQAKVAVDEVLYREGRTRPDFAAIDLRPGTLTDEPAGKVALGKVPRSRGNSSRASVAEVAALLLGHDGVRSAWLDTLDGDLEPSVAVDRVVSEGVDAAEGEPFYVS